MTNINLIDTHAHYNTRTIDNLDKQLLIANKNNDVSKIINVGLDYETSNETVKISIDNPKFYSAIGVHPLYKGNIAQIENLYNKYNNQKIVAIGETGIDTQNRIENQIYKFIDSINLANKLKLPVIIHSNTTKDSKTYAHKLCIEIIKKYKPNYGFVFHCFQPDLEILNEIIKLDGYISIGSKILKHNAKKSLEVVRIIPLDKLIIETDYSFLTDTPNQTGKDTFNKVCELKNKPKILMMKQLNNNAEKLFPKIQYK